jgi:hypothetical protein
MKVGDGQIDVVSRFNNGNMGASLEFSEGGNKLSFFLERDQVVQLIDELKQSIKWCERYDR